MEEMKAMQDLQGYFTKQQIADIISNAPTEELRLLFELLKHGRRITEILGRQEYTHRNVNGKATILDTNTDKKIVIEQKEKLYPAVQGLRPNDIDKEKRLVEFRILKKRESNNKRTSHLFTLKDSTYNNLLGYIHKNNIQPKDTIFKLNRFQASYQLKKICKGLDILKVGKKAPHLHNFRHSFAVNLLSEINDPAAIVLVKDALCHSNINITSGYLQFSQEKMREIINKAL